MNDENTIVRNTDTIRDVLRNVCSRNEIAFLATPYAKFELNFLLFDGEVFHVTATMSREDALYGLKSPNLTIRFPYGHRIFRAATSLLGIGLARGRKSLRLTVPAMLENDDFRRAFRVEKVGRVHVTFSSRKYDLLTGTLVNLSTGGARIFSTREFEEDEIKVDDVIHITIPVSPEMTINTQARVRHVGDRAVGLEFKPTLSGPLLDNLSRWAFQKKEEALTQFANQSQAEAPPHESAVPVTGEPMIALIGVSPELEARLAKLLTGLPPLRRLPATVQTMRSLAETPNALVFYHLEDTSQLQLRRASVLLEPLKGKAPFILLGSTVDPSGLIQMANDWEALMGYSIGGTGDSLIARVVGGFFKTRVK